MGMKEAEFEFNQLKEVIDSIAAINKRAQEIDLRDVEMSLNGNSGNPQALDNLERTLRSVRARILSELAGLVQGGIARTPNH